MLSSDGVSRFGLETETPFSESQSRMFEVLLWSRSQVHLLEALSTATIRLSKAFVNQRVLSAEFEDKKQSKQVG